MQAGCESDQVQGKRRGRSTFYLSLLSLETCCGRADTMAEDQASTAVKVRTLPDSPFAVTASSRR